jgi:uridine kinase
MIIAIDGRAAAGKTTAAQVLAENFGAGIIHMDDFFLPENLRTAERLAMAGENFQHERFAEEVLPFLRSGEAFSYNIFDCALMAINGKREVTKSRVRIIEGAYSCHPLLGEYMDLRLFADIAPDEQLQRITIRNGAEQAEIFASKWIPLEEAYLKTFGIKENAHQII